MWCAVERHVFLVGANLTQQLLLRLVVSMSSGCPHSGQRPGSRRSSRRLRCPARLYSTRSTVTAPRLARCREDRAGVFSGCMRRPDAVLLHEGVGEEEELPHHRR